jgi:hypothetical protein
MTLVKRSNGKLKSEEIASGKCWFWSGRQNHGWRKKSVHKKNFLTISVQCTTKIKAKWKLITLDYDPYMVLEIHWKRQKDPALHSIKGQFPHTSLLHQQDVHRENAYEYSQYGQPWNWASKADSMHSSDSESASFPSPSCKPNKWEWAFSVGIFQLQWSSRS